MEMKSVTRSQFGFAASGKCIEWIGRGSDVEITKEDALDLVQRILGLVGLRIREMQDTQSIPAKVEVGDPAPAQQPAEPLSHSTHFSL
jgi:hypothetical protein